jgi:serine/threonine protein kinase
VFEKFGSSGRTRTYNPSVNSRMACSRLTLQPQDLETLTMILSANWGDSGGTLFWRLRKARLCSCSQQSLFPESPFHIPPQIDVINSVYPGYFVSPNEWHKVKCVLAKALALPADERLAWVREIEGLQPSLIREVERLLAQELESTLALSQDHNGASRSGNDRLLKPGDKPLDRFEILFFLGSGGMGEVYAAFDNDLREVIALKTLRADLANQPVYVRRLQKEVQIARRLRHENLCRVYDTHSIPVNGGTTQAVSMELLHGDTLHRSIRTGKITLDNSKAILEQLVSGLESVHQAGILHRDLKTGNVILTRDADSRMRAVITDFGLALDTRAPMETQTQFGLNAVVGTPSYMAPEQLRGEGASVASDVYALGVVAFEILTGRLPFEGETSLAVALRRFGREAPSPRTHRPDVPRRWAMAIQCCLAETPHQRPETPHQFLEALEGKSGTVKVMARRHGRRAGILGILTVLASLGAFEWPRPRHRPPPEAEARFKKGEVFVSRRSADGIASAIEEFRRAIEIDPKYAEAWASLANAYCAAIHYEYLEPKNARREADAAARKAIGLDPNLAMAHGALAYLRSVDLRTWRSADVEFESALRLDSREPLCHAWYAAFLGRMGRFQEALAEAKKAVSLAPGDFYFNHQLAAEYFRARRFQEYLTQSQELVRLQPGEVDSHLGLARAFEWLGRFAEGFGECDAADRIAPDHKSSITILCFRGTIEAAQGDLKTARVRARAVEDYWRTNPIEPNILISLYARLRDYGKVMAILHSALAAGDPNVLVCPTNPYLDAMRGLPEYQAFLRKVGFDPAEVLKFG